MEVFVRSTLFLICVLAISCGAVAQNNQASWASLRGLRAGQKIQIVDLSSKKHSGDFESISDTAISIKEAAGESSIQRQDVRSVKLMRSNRRLRNTLIYAGIGAGAGAGIGAGVWESRGFLGGKGTGAAVCAGIGGLAGIITGALLPTNEIIYKASSH
jgi:hypothetical protein